MMSFKTWLFAAVAVLSVTTTTAAETEMEQVGHWLKQLGPKLEPTRAGPDLTKCEGGGNFLECKQRLLDEQLVSLQNVRLFLDQEFCAEMPPRYGSEDSTGHNNDGNFVRICPQ